MLPLGEEEASRDYSINRFSDIPGPNEIHFVCVREDGSYMSSRSMADCSKVIHRKVTPAYDYHSLRHTHCSMLVAAHCVPDFVKERMGHKSVREASDTYTHISPAMDRENVNLYQDWFGFSGETSD